MMDRRATNNPGVIVTGASGFIGRRLAARVARERPAVRLRCLIKDEEDDFYRGGSQFLEFHSLRPVPTDLACGKGLEGLQSPDLVFHLAANTHTWESDHSCNDRGTQNLLRAVAPLRSNTHIVFTSTTAVMDNRGALDTPLGPLASVERPPLSRYGLSKWRAEEFLRSEAARQGFRLSIVRLCTVYGPCPRPNTLFDVLKSEVARQTVASRLNWPGLTSVIHVDDVVNCLIRVGDSPPAPGEVRVYLLATESKTLADISKLLYRVQGLIYRMISLPQAAWRFLRNSHRLCRLCAAGRTNLFPLSRFPAFRFSRIYNALWRFNTIVNPVFHCDTSSMNKYFPDLKPKLMADCIHEILNSDDWRDEILMPSAVALNLRGNLRA